MLISLGVPEVKLKTGWEIQVIKVKNLQSLSDAVVQCRSQPSSYTQLGEPTGGP